MVSIFNTTLIKNDHKNIRISLGVLCGVILLLIFVFGRVYTTKKDACAGLLGCPESFVFITMWILVVLTLLLSFMVVIFNYPITAVVTVFSFITMFVIFAILWLFFYNHKNNPSTSLQMLGLCVFFALLNLFTLSSFVIPDRNNQAKFVATITAVPALSWTLFAQLLNVQDNTPP